MTTSVKQTTNQIAPAQAGYDLYKLLRDVQLDIAALRASIVAITAKLDLDGGVTGTDFASTCDPAAQKSVA